MFHSALRRCGVAFSFFVLALMSGASFADWSGSGNPGQGGLIRGMYAQPGTSPTVLLAAPYGSGIFKSSDGGTSWSASNSGLGNKRTMTVRAQPIATTNPAWALTGTEGNGIYRSVDVGANWSASNTGLNCLYVRNIGVFSSTTATDYGTPDTVYAATSCDANSGVYKSSDGGQSWTMMDLGVANTNVNNVRVAGSAPNQGKLVWAATLGQGIFMSSNGGVTWTRNNGTGGNIVSGPTGSGNTAVVFDVFQASGYALAVVEGGGIFKSTDSGVNWFPSNTGLPNTIPTGGISSTNSNAKLYIPVSGAGFYRSSDAGVTWSFFAGPAQGLPEMDRILISDPTTSTTFYAGTFGGIYKSPDSGVTWAAANTGLGGGYGSFTATDPNNSQNVLGIGSGTLYRSTDGGVTWAKSNAGLTSFPHIVRFARGQANLALVATQDQGVFRSSDGGVTWTQSNTGLPANMAGMDTRIRQHPVNSNVFYLTLDGQGIYRSTDYGVTWSASSTGLSGSALGSLSSVTVDALSQTTVYVTTRAGFYRSTDGGASWGQITALPSTGIQAGFVSIDPVTPTNIYVAAYVPNPAPGGSGPAASGGIWKSSDGGATWIQKLNNLAMHVAAIDDGTGSAVYAAVWDEPNGGVLKSVDGGATWTPDSTGLQSNYVRTLNPNFSRNRLLRASTFGGGVANYVDAGEAAALADINTALTAFQTYINANSATLDASGLMPFYDANFKEDGNGANVPAAGVADFLRGGSVNGASVSRIISIFTDAGGNMIANTAGTMSFTTGQGPGSVAWDEYNTDDGPGMNWWRKAAGGSWKPYGNQLLARLRVQAFTETRSAGNAFDGTYYFTWFNAKAPSGSAASISVNGPGFANSPLVANGTMSEQLQASPLPAPPLTFNYDQFALMPPAIPGLPPVGTEYAFTVTPTSGLPQQVLKAVQQTTTETISINIPASPGSHALADAHLGGSLTANWTLPATFTVQSIEVHMTTNSSAGMCNEFSNLNSLPPTATTFTFNPMPATCLGQPIADGVSTGGHPVQFTVQINGTKGEMTRSWYAFGTPGCNGNTPPGGLAATSVLSSQVALQWTKACMPTTVANYGVWRGIAAGGPFSLVGTTDLNTPSFTDTSVSAGQQYFYYVVATDGTASVSADSNHISVTTPAGGATVPGAPVGVSAGMSGNTMTMNWTAVSGATSYNVYQAMQSGVTKANYLSLASGHLHASVTNPFIHTSVGAGTWYLVVTALNAAGESVESSEVSVTVSAGAGGAPTLYIRPTPGVPGAGLSVREGQSVGYEAALVNPDGSIVFPLASAGLSWSIVSGPASVGAGTGLVTGNAIAANTPAILQASLNDAALTNSVTITATSTIMIQKSQDQWTGGRLPAAGGDTRGIAVTGAYTSMAIFGAGVYRTSDGSNWERSSYGIPFGGSARARAIRNVPGSSTELIVAIEGSGIYRSTNSGGSWQPSNSGMTCNFPRALNSTDFGGGRLYAATTCGTPNGLFKSVDGGNTWTPVGAALPNNVNGVFAAGSSDVVWAWSNGNGLYKSTNAGTSWAQMNTGLPTPPQGLNIYAFHSKPNVTLVTVEGAGVYRSSNNGASWAAENTGLPASTAFQGGIGYNNDGYFYVSVEGAGIYRGTTGSTTTDPMTWSSWGNTTPANLPRRVFAPMLMVDGSYVVGSGQGVYHSLDNGNTWTPLKNGLPGGYVTNTVTDPTSPNVVYAAADTVYKSADSGATWSQSDAGITAVVSFAQRSNTGQIVRASDGALYVGSANGGLFKSSDGALTWAPVNTGLPALLGQGVKPRSDPNNAQIVYALFDQDQHGVYKSSDGGSNWNPISGNLAGNALNVSDLRVDSNGELYAATQDGVYKSSNGGTNWTQLAGTAGIGVNHVRIDTVANPHALYWSVSASDGFSTPLPASGLYRSTDGGANITQILANTLTTNFNVVNQGFGPTLYATSWNFDPANWGVYRSTDNGVSWQTLNAGLGHARVSHFDTANQQLMHVATQGGGVFTFAASAAVPGAPTIGTATAGNAQATVSFTAPASDGGSPISGYTVTSSPGGFTATGTASPITVSGLANGTAYTFTVTATNSIGASAASAASNSVAPSGGITVPSAPLTPNAVAGNGQATVTFAAPGSTGGAAITGYTVTSSPAGGGDLNAGSTSLSHVVTGLTNGTAYTFTVTATNSQGTGAASAASNSVTPAADTPAQALAAVNVWFSTLQGIVNAQGNALDYTQLGTLFDAAYFDSGYNKVIGQKKLASNLRGSTLNSMSNLTENSYDAINQVISVAATVSATQNSVTTNFLADGRNDGLFVFKRQADGSYRSYGNQQIANTESQVQMRTDVSPGFTAGPRQHVNIDLDAPIGTVTAVSVSGPGLGTPLALTLSQTRIETIQSSPSVSDTLQKDVFIGGFDPGTSIANGSVFAFAVTPVSGPVQNYNVTYVGNAVTDTVLGAVVVTAPTAHTLADANLGSPLNLTWTLPTAFTVVDLHLSGSVNTAVAPAAGLSCILDGNSLAPNATSGSITLPATCSGQAIQQAYISVTANGANGESAMYSYGFSGSGGGGAPAIPTGLFTAGKSQTQIWLAWNAVPGATSYGIYRSTTSGSSGYVQIATSGSTGYVDTTVQPGPTYFYEVTAISAGGESVGSQFVSSTTLACNVGQSDCITPSVTPAVTATVNSTTQVTVNWSASSDNVGVTAYRVNRGFGSTMSFLATVGSGTFGYVDTTAAPGTAYIYFVQACDAANNCSVGSGAFATTPPTGGAVNIVGPHAVQRGGSAPYQAWYQAIGASSSPYTQVTPAWSYPNGNATLDGAGNLSVSGALAADEFNSLSATFNVTGTKNIELQKSSDHWVGSSPAPGGDVRSLFTLNGGNTLVAGIYGGGIYRSSDGGASWMPSHFGLPRAFRGLRVIPDGSNTIMLAATEGDGVYRSVDGGQTWSASNTGLDCGVIRTLGGHGTNLVNTVYAATQICGLYKSTDSGMSWSHISSLPTTAPISQVNGSTNSQAVWVSTYGGGFYYSADAGVTWQSMSNGLPNGASTVVLSFFWSSANNLLAAVEGGGIYKTTNGSGNWFKSSTGLPASPIGDRVNPGIANLSNTSFPQYNGQYVTVDGVGVFKSTDDGATWNPFISFAAEPRLKRTFSNLTIGASGNLHIGTGAGVYMSTTGGATWHSMGNNGLPGGIAITTFTDPNAPNNVYALSDRIYKSTDGGTSWSASDNGIDVTTGQTGSLGVPGVITGNSAGPGIYAATVNGGVFKTSDGGANWSAVNNGLPAVVGESPTIRIHPTNNSVLFLGYPGSYVPRGAFQTSDGGANWTSISGDLAGSALYVGPVITDPASGALYAGTRAGLYRSANGGLNWTQVFNISTGRVSQVRLDAGATPAQIYFVVADAADNNLYQPTGMSGLWRMNADGSGVATQFLSGRNVANFRVLRNPGLSGPPSAIYAALWEDNLANGTPSGIVRSLDGGATWSELNAGVTVGPRMYNFEPSADGTQILRVTSNGGGVYNFVADITPPSTPGTLVLDSAAANQINFHAASNSTDDSGSVVYNVDRNGVRIFSNLALPTVADTSLAPSTSYSYALYACDASGNCSTASTNSFSTTDGAATVPGAPLSVNAVAGNGQATVTFAAPGSDGGSTILGYTVTPSPAGGIDSNAGSTSLSHVVTGLTNGTAYTFTVIANNSVGPSAPSAASSPAVTPLADTQTQALAGVNSWFANLQSIVNPRGSALAYTDLVNVFDAAYLDRGYPIAYGQQKLASNLRGVTLNSLSNVTVNSYDPVNQVISVAGTVSITQNSVTSNDPVDGNQQGLFIFKRQADGSYLSYGDQRIARLLLKVEMLTISSAGSTVGPQQTVSFEVIPPIGTVSAATVAGPGITGSLNLHTSGTFWNQSWEGSPGVFTAYQQGDFNNNVAPTAVTSGATYTFTLTPAVGAPVSYNVTFSGTPVTDTVAGSISITSPTGHLLSDANPGNPLNFNWTLPTAFTVTNLYLEGWSGGSGGSCTVSGATLAPNATAGTLTLPASCGGQGITQALVHLTATGSNGEAAHEQYWFQTPPSVPQNVSASVANPTQVNVSWAPATGNVANYKVYRNSVLVASPTASPYNDTVLTASTPYTYTVAACDAQNSCSAPSAAVTVTTLAQGGNLSVPSLLFPGIALGSSSANQTMILTYYGSTLAITSANITGANAGDFAVTVNTCITLPPSSGGKCRIEVMFTPAATGSRTGTLTIVSNAANSPNIVGLSGTGMPVVSTAGNLWTSAGPGGPGYGGLVRGFQTTPDGTYWAAMQGAGIYRSQDSGNTWQAINNGLTSLRVTGIRVSRDPAIAATGSDLATNYYALYAPTLGGGMFRSTDGGASWSTINTGLNCAYANTVMQVFNYTPMRLFAGTACQQASGIYYSDDDGANWTLAGGLPTNVTVNSIARFGTPSGTVLPEFLLAMTDQGIYKSINQGVTWTLTDSTITTWGPRGHVAYSAASYYYSGVTTQVVLAAVEGVGVFRSTDQGANWAQVTSGLPAGGMPTAGITNDGSGNFYVPIDGWGVYESVDKGLTWTQLASNAQIPAARSVIVNNDQSMGGGSFYFASTMAGVYRGTTNGTANVTWTGGGTGLPGGWTTNAALDSGSNIYVAAADGVYKRDGTTHALSRLGQGNLGQMQNSHLILSSTGTLYAGTTNLGVFLYSSGNNTWVAMNSGLPANLAVQSVQLRFDPTNTAGPGLWAGLYGEGVYYSADGGATWTSKIGNLSGNALKVRHLQVSGTTVLISTDAGIWQSVNSGASWTQRFVPTTAGTTYVDHLALDTGAGSPFTAYAAVYNTDALGVSYSSNGVYKSSDGGTTWTPLAGLAGKKVHDIKAARTAGGLTLYAGVWDEDGSGGAYQSTDGGTNWTLTSGLANIYVSAIGIDGTGVPFGVATLGDGLYQYNQPITVPGAPTIGTATAGNAQATVTFAAPASNGGAAITGYTVTSIPAGGVDSNAGTTGLSHVITALANGTAYSFTVSATNSVGTGAASAASNSVTPTAPDTQAPSVPTGVTATAVSSSQINLSWTASADNVGVTQYKIYRGGNLQNTLNGTPPVTAYSDTGLTAATAYSYTVAACDAAANCSAQSAAASATTLSAGPGFTPSLVPGWNLLGNSLNITLDVATIFGTPTAQVAGVTANIVSIWKWDAANAAWAYYAPLLTTAQIAAFTTSKGYLVLAGIGPGEGYWVNAAAAFTMAAQSGAAFSYTSVNYQPLPPAWNLIATAQNLYPSSFTNTVSTFAPPAGGQVNAADTFVSLWAWDATQAAWYYYSPVLENTTGAQGGLTAVKNFATSKGYLHFQDSTKKLDIGTGFWVNKVQAP